MYDQEGKESNISGILKKKDASDKELAEAKSMIASLNGKVENLLADLGKAQEENKKLTAQNQDLSNQNTSFY